MVTVGELCGVQKALEKVFNATGEVFYEVLRVLETEGIARVANRLYPVANIKGTD